MSDIAGKVRTAIEDGTSRDRGHALLVMLAKAEAWQAQGMPWSAIGDEILLTLAAPLGLRLTIGQYAQLVDLDEVDE